MNLRALILLGWEKTETAGAPPVVNLYTGQDGIELAKAHAEALKTGKYLAFRKIINPSGVPMQVVADPAPKAPVEANKAETPNDEHPVGILNRKKKAAADKASENSDQS